MNRDIEIDMTELFTGARISHELAEALEQLIWQQEGAAERVVRMLEIEFKLLEYADYRDPESDW